MNKKVKLFLAWLMAVAICFSTVSEGVLAAELSDYTVTEKETEVGDTEGSEENETEVIETEVIETETPDSEEPESEEPETEEVGTESGEPESEDSESEDPENGDYEFIEDEDERAEYNAQWKASLEEDENEAEATSARVSNDYLDIAVASDGKFTFGTTGGNPNFTSDNNKKLLYGHPSPGTSETLIYYNGQEKLFTADTISSTSDSVTATMTLDQNVKIIQKLTFVTGNSSSAKDMVRISYQVVNQANKTINVGIRIMMDTMLASNDYAPFKVPGLGNVTTCRTLTKTNMPQTYQVYDNLDNPTTMASGTLYTSEANKPDKVMFTNWSGIRGSGWNYTRADGTSLGDSAVAVIYNPRSVLSGNSFSVETYYGVGYLVNDVDSDKIDSKYEAKNDEIVVRILDYKTKKSVSGATVSIPGLGDKTTNSSGMAVYQSNRDYTNKTVTISGAGYSTDALATVLKRGTITTIYAKSTTSNEPMITSAILENRIDMTSTVLEYYANTNGIDVNKAQQINNITLKVTSDKAGCVYQLMQGTSVKQQNTTGVFTLTTILKDENGKIVSAILDGFSAGETIKVRCISNDGYVSPAVNLGFKIYEQTFYKASNKAKLTLGSKISVESGKGTLLGAFLGDNATLSFGPSILPVSVSQDESGKVQILVNKPNSIDDVNFVKKYKEFEARADKLKSFGESKMKCGSLDFDFNIIGYGEGNLVRTESGTAGTIDLTLIVKGKASLKGTTEFLIVVVPAYVSIKGTLEVGCTLNAQVMIQNSGMSFKMTGGKLEPSFSLKITGGLGADGVAGIEASGTGKISYSHNYSSKYRKVELNGTAEFRAYFLWVEYKKELVNKTFKIWDGYDNSASEIEVLDTSEEIFGELEDQDQFSIIPRDYKGLPAGNESISIGDSGVTYWESGVFTNAQPQIVNANGKLYRFWIADLEERDIYNRTALVYSCYDAESESWSAPTAINNDGYADANYCVLADGDKIYIAWQKSKQNFNEENTTTTGILAAQEIKTAVLNTTSNAVAVISTVTNNAFADLSPKMAKLSNGNIALAWYSLSESVLIGSADQETVIHYCTYNGSSFGAVKDIQISDGEATFVQIASMDLGCLNNNPYVSFAVDVDGDTATSSDRELYLWDVAEADAVKLTNNDVTDDRATFGKLGSTQALFWMSGNDICYVTGAEAEVQTVDMSDAQVAPTGFVLANNGTKTTILWSGNLDEDSEEQTIFAKEYSGSWSKTKLWTNGVTGSVLSASAVYDSEGDVILSFQSISRYVDEDEETTELTGSDLCTAETTPVEDLTISDFDYELNDAGAGENLEIDVQLTNSGNKTIDSAIVYVNDEEQTTVTGLNLQAGATITRTITVAVPNNSSHEMTVTVATEDENAYSDNSFVIEYGYTDISVEEGEHFVSADTEYVPFTITNDSRVDAANVMFRLIADVEDGTVIYEHSIGTLPAGESVTVFCQNDVIASSTIAYMRLTTTTDELITSNNSGVVSNGKVTLELLNESLVSIESSNVDAGTATANDTTETTEYQQNDVINLVAEPSEGMVFVEWTSEDSNGNPVDVSYGDKYSPTTSMVVPDRDVIVRANFATENPATILTVEDDTVEIKEFEKYSIDASIAPSACTDHLTYELCDSDGNVVSTDTSISLKNNRITGVAEGTGYVKVSAKDALGNVRLSQIVTVTVSASHIESMRMVLPRVTLEGVNKKETLSVITTPADVSEGYRWVSADESIVKVNASTGEITSVKAGTTTVSAISESGLVSANCQVTVIVPLESISLNYSSLAMNKGTTKTVTLAFNPTTTSENPTITWSVSNSSVATVTPAANKRSAVIKAVGKGSCTVLVNVGDRFSVACDVTVLIPATGISLNKTSATITKGSSLTLTRTIVPSDSTDSITWTSSNTSIATVSNGTVYGKSQGTATITAKTTSGKTATCKVTVKIIPATAITLPQSTLTIEEGSSEYLTYNLTPTNSTDTVTLTSADTSIATVSGNRIYAKAFGHTTVTVQTESGKTAVCNVNVTSSSMQVENVSTLKNLATPHPYENRTNKMWVYTQSNASSISFKFSDDSITENGYDRIYIYDKNNDLKQVYTGTEMAGQWVTITGTTVKILFKSDGSVTKNGFTITDAKLVYNMAKATASVSKQYYTGSEIKAKPVVKMGSNTLKEGTDYTLSYSNNTDIGTATVTITGKGNYQGTIKKKFTIGVKKGGKYTLGSYTYTVTNAKTDGKGTVSLTGFKSSKATSVTIKDKVTIGGVSFKVTAIGSKAFYKKTKITTVSIGKNVTEIGSKAFNGCSSIKSVTIKSSGITKMGSKSWSGIKSKCVFKVPSKKVTSYKKMLIKAGAEKTIQVKKL